MLKENHVMINYPCNIIREEWPQKHKTDITFFIPFSRLDVQSNGKMTWKKSHATIIMKTRKEVGEPSYYYNNQYSKLLANTKNTGKATKETHHVL